MADDAAKPASVARERRAKAPVEQFTIAHKEAAEFVITDGKGTKLGDIEMDATILPADHPRSGVPVTVVGDGQPSRESRVAQNLLHISAELQKG